MKTFVDSPIEELSFHDHEKLVNALCEWINNNHNLRVTCERLLGGHVTEEEVPELLDVLQDILDHGMSGGVGGFIYHVDCREYLQQLDFDELYGFLEEAMQSMGMQYGYRFFGTFDLIELLEYSLDNTESKDALAIHSTVAWAYVEHLADRILNMMEDDEDE